MEPNLVNVHLNGIPLDTMHTALEVCKSFAMQYPDRVGIRSLVVYTKDYANTPYNFVVYRTRKGRIVIRLSQKD
jgi:hypothetical protein